MKKTFILTLVILGCLVTPKSSRTESPALKETMDLTYDAQFERAEEVLGRYISENPQDPLAYIVRGNLLDWKQSVLILGGQLNEKSLEDYKRANKLAFLLWDREQEDTDHMVALGNSYMFLAKKWLDLDKSSRAGLVLKKCKRHLEKAVSKDPQRWDAYLALGIFNFYAANIPPGLKFIASLLGISGNEELGLKQMNLVASHSNLLQPHARYLLAYALGRTKKRYKAALTHLERLIADYPNNPHFLSLKGEYSAFARLYDQSRRDYDNLFRLCKSNPKGTCHQSYYFQAHYYIGSGYIEQRNWAAAKPHLWEAARLNENRFKDWTVRLHYYKGLVLRGLGDKKGAVKEFKKVEALQGDNLPVWQLTKEALAEMGVQ